MGHKLRSVFNLLKRLAGLTLDILTFIDFKTSENKTAIRHSQKLKEFISSDVGVYVTYKHEFNDLYESRLYTAFRNLNIPMVVIINGDYSLKFEKRDDLSLLIFRRNLGYDLGAIRDFLNMTRTIPLRNIFIFNSSMAYLPNIENFIREIRDSTGDFVSVGVESYQKIRHFQSFFFHAAGNGIPELRKAFTKVRNVRFKRTHVNFGEIAISRHLINKCSVDLRVRYSFEEIFGRLPSCFDLMGISENPTLNHESHLIFLGAPFIKRVKLNTHSLIM